MTHSISNRVICILLLFTSSFAVEARNITYDEKIEEKNVSSIVSQNSTFVNKSQIVKLEINGASYISKSFVSNANIVGNLLSEWSDIKNLKMIGNAKLTLKSNIDILDIFGDVEISDSTLDHVELNGKLTSKNSTINIIRAATGNIYLWNTNIDKAFIVYYPKDDSPITIGCFGASKIKELHISSTSKVQPIARIILDSKASKGFNRASVISSGQVEYVIK